MHGTGIALGLFEHSDYSSAETVLSPGDLLVFYSDGITEAEDPSGQPLEETGLELVLERHADKTSAAIGAEVLAAVHAHARRARFADDLTIRRSSGRRNGPDEISSRILSLSCRGTAAGV